MPITLQLRRTRPITAPELESALQKAEVLFERSQANDDAWWTRYPFDPALANSGLPEQPPGELWFRAALEDDGGVALSISASNSRLLRNLTDLTARVPRIAATLGARLFAGEREVDLARAPSLVADGDPFLETARGAFRACLAAMDELPLGAIELPIGNKDLVEEYALFQVQTTNGLTLDDLVANMRANELFPLLYGIVEKKGGIYITKDGELGAQVFLRDDGLWQVRPVHGRSVWRIHAATMMAAVMRLYIDGGMGSILWQGVPLTGKENRSIEERGRRSALEFALFTRSVRSANIVPHE